MLMFLAFCAEMYVIMNVQERQIYVEWLAGHHFADVRFKVNSNE